MLRALAHGPPSPLRLGRAITGRAAVAMGAATAEPAVVQAPPPAQLAADAPPLDPAALPQPGESILLAAQRVLRAASPSHKAALSHAAYELFKAGQLALPPAAGGPPLPHDLPPVPTRPARDSRITVLPPGKVKRLKAGGTVSSRAAILHSLAHIENWAVDVFFDIIAR